MITYAAQKGSFVNVYNERGDRIFTREGVLVTFTAFSVTLKNGSITHTYNDRGQMMYTKPLNYF